MKKLLFVVSCLLVLSVSPVLAQEAPAVVTAQLGQDNGRLYVSVSTGSGPAQTQKFVPAKSQTYGQMVAEQSQKLVSTYIKQGYVLQGIIPGGQMGNGNSSSTLIFVKSAPVSR
ncbi:hypothetical protein [Hymenobacter sp. DG01]|uniref:hypothetical protein n=1 Tax=Hymenobacter sp. DG01 TaxID=2584940 RepID=UPI00111CCBF0|nr:hypothetical protein [Hymenobacter sp. DG01]